jgi:hypothetical protein
LRERELIERKGGRLGERELIERKGGKVGRKGVD